MDKENFYFVGANEWTNQPYDATEFAFTAFNFKEGITKELCVIKKPSANSQEIENPNYGFCRNSIEALLKITDFFKPFRKIPTTLFTSLPYCNYETFKNDTKLVKKLFEEAGEYEIASELIFIPLNHLLQYFTKYDYNWEGASFKCSSEFYDIIKNQQKKFNEHTVSSNTIHYLLR